MKLRVITDGISLDFEHALAVMDEFGLDHAELQYLWDKEVGVPCSAATAGCQATSPGAAAAASSALRRVTLPPLPASFFGSVADWPIKRPLARRINRLSGTMI